jgi:branched-chain amino acid transport system permease protein
MLTQLIANGIIIGSAYALMALGFFVIYSTTRVFHFAHGAVYGLGAYIFYLCYSIAGAPIVVGMLASVLFTSAAGILIELIVYRPLRYEQAGPLVFLVSSLGVFVALQNAIILGFGTDTRAIGLGRVNEGYIFGNVTITSIQLVTLAASAFLFVLTAIILKRTRSGAAMRALASNPEMTEIIGIDIGRISLVAFGLGSAYAAIGGILTSLDTGLDPWMGTNAILMATVAVVIGGARSLWGTAVGGLMIGLAQNVGIWQISSKWQNAIAFGLLLVFLIVRPKGILGGRVQETQI